MKRLTCLLLSLAAYSFLHAQSTAPTPSEVAAKTILEAEEEVFFDDKTQRLVATPNARLSSGNFLLTADRIEYDRNRTKAFASGQVTLTDGMLRLLAQDLEINLGTGDFKALEVKAGFYPWATQGKQIIRNKGLITSKDSSFYLRGKHPLEPNLLVRQLTFDQNKSSFTGKGVTFRLGEKQLGKLPSLSGKLGQNPFGYGLHAGQRDRLGWYLGTEGEWQLSEAMQTQGELTAYEKRGVFISPRIDWEADSNDGFQRTSIEHGWIQDQGNERGVDLRGLAIGESRNYLHAYSVNRFRERWRFAAQMEWEDDSEVFRDFRRDRFQDQQWNDHFGELAYESDNWTLSALTKWQANNHEAMVEQHPNIRFDLAPTPWPDTKIYNTLAFEFGGFRKKDETGSLVSSSKRFDLGYQIQRPFNLGKGFTYTPFLSYRLQDYSLDGPDAMQSWGEWGNDLHYSMHGDYDIQNEVWNINGLRHILNFSISHRKVNRLDSERTALIPLLDYSLIDLNMGPTDLLDKLEADDLEPYEVIRIGWANHLLAKSGESTRELLSVHLFQDLWYDNESGDDLQRNFHAGVSVHPAHWLSLAGQAKIDLDRGETIRNIMSATIRDGRINEFELAYFNYQSFSDQWQFLASHRISERKALHGALRLQGDRPKIPYWQITLEYRPTRSWAWFFAIAERTGTAKENETEATASVRLFSF